MHQILALHRSDVLALVEEARASERPRVQQLWQTVGPKIEQLVDHARTWIDQPNPEDELKEAQCLIKDVKNARLINSTRASSVSTASFDPRCSLNSVASQSESVEEGEGTYDPSRVDPERTGGADLLDVIAEETSKPEAGGGAGAVGEEHPINVPPVRTGVSAKMKFGRAFAKISEKNRMSKRAETGNTMMSFLEAVRAHKQAMAAGG